MTPKKSGWLLALVSLLAAALLLAEDTGPAHHERWTQDAATAWYAHEPWLVGSNYIPSYAANELEMWQADTFDAKRIDIELGWAEGLGMNTMRVFLHDLLWKQDSEGFKKRMDTFLGICDRHKIKPLFVLFDSCWDPFPHLGPQPAPRPGIHNSRWLQSPGAEALQDFSQYPRLEAYVKGVVGAFAKDPRILGWDVWNEPDNTNDGSYGNSEPKNKVQLVLALLPKAFDWARDAQPAQPLTSGVWHGDWSNPANLEPMSKEQLELSDIISFHNYSVPNDFEKHVKWLQQYARPIICTEYMARGEKSTFEGILPIAKQYKVGAINWGFVKGKTQTYLPWDSWKQPYVYRSPAMWFHDIFYEDGRPYRPEEVAFIRKMTGKSE
jgi:Cellulase (glycosyl hydrolase family 5)